MQGIPLRLCHCQPTRRERHTSTRTLPQPTLTQIIQPPLRHHPRNLLPILRSDITDHKMLIRRQSEIPFMDRRNLSESGFELMFR